MLWGASRPTTPPKNIPAYVISHLRGAILDGTILDKANLLNAQLDNSLQSHGKDHYAFEIQNQRGANRDFHGVDLNGLNLRACDLSGSNLAEANLEQTDLSNANLQNAQLNNANLSRANLAETQLTSGTLQGVRATGAIFDGANLVETSFMDADLTDASLAGADLMSANLQNANCSGVNFIGSNLSNANLENCTLTNSMIYGVNFSQAVNIPEPLLNYLDTRNSLKIRPLHRFTSISDHQRQICSDQYGPEADQYADYAIWFNQVPLLPSYQVPRSLLDAFFRLSPLWREDFEPVWSPRFYSTPFFFNIFFKPASLWANLDPNDDEKRALIELGAQVFAPIDVFYGNIDSDYDRTIRRPALRQSSEEFAQWLIQTSRLQMDEDPEDPSTDVASNTPSITAAATELANLVGEEIAICRLNEGDYNENEQYSAYGVISRNYLMFVLKYWEL